jgi:hypothetical protein
MSADDQLSEGQFTTVYHSTDPGKAREILASGKFRGDAADNYTFVSVAQKSRYMDVYGNTRIKLRVPTEHLEDDPSLVGGWEGNEHLMGRNEEHYAINADKIAPEHIVEAKQVNPITGKLHPFRDREPGQ